MTEPERSGRPVLIIFVIAAALVFAALWGGIYFTDSQRTTKADLFQPAPGK